MHHVIFDIGGVLVDYSVPRLMAAIAAETGLPPSAGAPLLSTAAIYEVESGRISGREFFATRVQPLIPGWTYDDWVRVWMDNYSLNPAGVALLETVRSSGRPVYLLSNLAEYNRLAIERKFPGFLETTRANFFSYELRSFKPEPAIYREACRRIGAPPAECVFIDDLPANVAGAVSAGLHGLAFANDRAEEIRRLLLPG